MRCLVLVALVACSYAPQRSGLGASDASTGGGDGDGDGDAATTSDAPAVAACPSDPHLRLCFSFDQPSFGATLPDEGAAVVDAQLTNVTRVDHDSGGAALVDTTSTIWLPMNADVTDIQAIEVAFRADADVADGARWGLVDSNIIPPNISLFVGRVGASHQLRCGVGGATATADVTLALGTWYAAACVCDADVLQVFLDGTKVGETSGPCSSGGALVSDGLTIGQNNNGGSTGVNDWLVGAIDRVRIWDQTIVPAP